MHGTRPLFWELSSPFSRNLKREDLLVDGSHENYSLLVGQYNIRDLSQSSDALNSKGY